MKNIVSSMDEAQNIGHAELLEIVTQQKRQIEKLEFDCSMLNQFVLSLASSSKSEVSNPRMSIEFALDLEK